MPLSPRNINLRQLHAFLTVADLGSVTRAAAVLNTSQPAVSRSIRDLEHIVGRPLFVRSGAGLTLTAVGEAYRRSVGTALAQIDTGTRAAQGVAIAPTVGIGVLPNVMRGLAPVATARFKTLAPQIKVEVYWSNVQTLLDTLRRGQIELILGRLLSMEQMSGLNFEQLFTESLVFVVAADHPLTRIQPLGLEAIKGFEVVIPLRGTIIRTEMDRFIFARGIVAFERTIESVSFEFTRAYLRLMPAVACLPMGAVRRELAEGTLVRLPIEGDELVGSVGIATVSGHRLSPEAQMFADCVREVVADGSFISKVI